MFGIHRPVKKEQLSFRGLAYTLYRTSRKTVSLQCKESGELVVRAPYLCTVREIEQVLDSRRDWIRTKQDAMARAREESDRPESHYFDGALLPFGNGSLRLRLDETPEAKNYTVTLHEKNGSFELVLRGAGLPAETCKKLVSRWGRKYAASVFRGRLEQFADVLGVSFGTLTIKETKTRWGSCSALGNITLHWKLLMVPHRLSDYIIVHELCHRFEMNHSAAFWSYVESVLPDYRERRAELRKIEKQILSW